MGVVEADPLLEDVDKGEYSAMAAAVERIKAVIIPALRNERLESTREVQRNGQLLFSFSSLF